MDGPGAWMRRDRPIHRIRNFGEDLWKAARDTGTVACSPDEIDRTTDTICARARSARRLRREIAVIETLLGKHNLGSAARITIVASR